MPIALPSPPRRAKTCAACCAPGGVQFYTSAAALTFQLPLMMYNHTGAWWRSEHTWSNELAFYLILNGAAFHLQSVMAYAVMGLISPVSQSVANTLKRALLIWLSILYFGNQVTWLSALGTVVCIGGVFAYNHARRVYPYTPPPLLPTSTTKEDRCGS
jgi:solute carrier family 35 protein E2